MSMVTMGHVIGPFGVQGWVKVFPSTEIIEGLLDYPIWWLGRGDNSWQEMVVVNSHINGNTLTVKFKECSDRTTAALLKGMQIAIPRDQLPVLSENGEDGYYWSDLIGMVVVNVQGDVLGTVNGLLETGANDVLQVQNPATEDKLIPFINQVIVKVDLKARQLTVDWGVDY